MNHYTNMVERLRRTPLAGLMTASLSGMWFTLSNFMVQMSIDQIKHKKMPIHEIVFMRSLEQLMLLVPIILIFSLNILVAKADILSLILMSLSGFLNMVFIYLALEKIPISDALVITFTSPVFTLVLSFFILKEKCHWLDALCGFFSFIGVVIVARPTFLFGKKAHKQVMFREGISKAHREIIYLMGATYALLGGISLALYFVMTRKFATGSQNIVNLFYPSITGTLLSPVIMLALNEDVVIPQTTRTVFIMLSVGFFSTIGLGMLALSLTLEDATNVALVRNLDVVYAYVLQYFVMGIKPSTWSIGGGLIIISMTSVLALRRQKMCRKCLKEDDVEEEVKEPNEVEGGGDPDNP